MNRPDMDVILNDFKLHGIPSALDCVGMYRYILDLEAEFSKLQNSIHNSDYTKCPKCGSDKVEQKYFVVTVIMKYILNTSHKNSKAK